MRKWILMIIVLALVVVGYNYVYQEHKDITGAKPDFQLSAIELIQSFSDNPITAESTYLNKVIELSGKASAISNLDITLDDQIFCQLVSGSQPTKNVGDLVTVKGRLIGFDDLLEEIKLDQCSILNPNEK